MGHSSFEITMSVYTGSAPTVPREAADSLDSLFKPAG
jgi:hypothetical protein